MNMHKKAVSLRQGAWLLVFEEYVLVEPSVCIKAFEGGNHDDKEAGQGGGEENGHHDHELIFDGNSRR
jgi:hypothetical protein